MPQPFFLCQRAALLQQQQRRSTRHQHQQRGHHGQPAPVAPRIALRLAPRRGLQHRWQPLRQHAAQVVGKTLHAAVAVGGVALQGVQQHGVEVARQLPAQRLHAARQPQRGLCFVDARLAGRGRRFFQQGQGLARARLGAGFERAPAGQQFIQHHAERIDVGGGADRAAQHLLGCGVLRRVGVGVRAVAVAQRGRRRAGVVVQQPRHAKVQQLGAAAAIHQDVAGLDVPVHHQLPVCVRHRFADLQHQPQTLRHAELPGVGVIAQVQALHPFHDEVGAPLVVNAGVVQARDVRVLQPCADLPFARHALRQAGALGQARQLQRHFTLEDAVGALGQPDAAHAAAADLVLQAVGADDLAAEGVDRGVGQAWQRGQALVAVALCSQRAQQVRQQGLCRRRQLLQPGFALGHRQCQCHIEQAAEISDLRWGQRHGGCGLGRWWQGTRRAAGPEADALASVVRVAGVGAS